MYKLIVVDDQEWIRKGIISGIKWDKYAIQIVGQAEDGVEALDLVEIQKPHIIITDIRMPHMDGLELTKKILKSFPDAKVIILSGYEDFNFVQTALRSGAFDYILKPAGEKDLIRIVEKAIDVIREEENRRNNEEELKRNLRESLPVLRERYLQYLLEGYITIEDLNKKYGFLSFNLKNNRFIVMVLKIDDSNDASQGTGMEERQIILFAVKQMILEVMGHEFIREVSEAFLNRVNLLINYEDKISEKEVVERVQLMARKIQYYVDKYYKLVITIGIGRAYADSSLIPVSYKEALDAVEYQMYLGKGSIIYIHDVDFYKKREEISYPLDIEDKIIMSLKIGNKEGVKYYMDKFFEYLVDKKVLSPGQVKWACLHIAHVLSEKLLEWDIAILIIKDEQQSFEYHIKQLKTIEELKTWLMNLIDEVADKIIEEKNISKASVAHMIIEYIEKHYNEPVSLQDISNKVHLTPTYIPTFFKEHVGGTVVDYLTKIRIKKSKALLLNTDLKNYEIAERVGYTDSKYFGQVFKKYVGVTPKEYRQKISLD